MAVCPPQVRYLSEGKAIGAKSHKGFVATWNWLLSWVWAFRGGRGVTVKGARQGRPVIDVDIQPGEGVDVQCAGDGAPYVISASGGGGEVTFTGTDSTYTDAGDSFTFASASNSNVVVTASGTTLTIGVYYI